MSRKVPRFILICCIWTDKNLQKKRNGAAERNAKRQSTRWECCCNRESEKQFFNHWNIMKNYAEEDCIGFAFDHQHQELWTIFFFMYKVNIVKIRFVKWFLKTEELKTKNVRNKNGSSQNGNDGIDISGQKISHQSNEHTRLEFICQNQSVCTVLRWSVFIAGKNLIWFLFVDLFTFTHIN